VYFLKKFPAVVERLEATFCVFPEACEADEEGVASVTSEFLFNVAVCSETAGVDVAIAVEGVIMVILVESPVRFDT